MLGQQQQKRQLTIGFGKMDITRDFEIKASWDELLYYSRVEIWQEM